MNRRFRLMIIFLLVAFNIIASLSSAAAETETMYVKVETLPVFSESNEYIGLRYYGDKVEVIGWLDQWAKILYSNEDGVTVTAYVRSDGLFDPYAGTTIYYVSTLEGDPLNVRDAPLIVLDTLIGSLNNHEAVHVIDFVSDLIGLPWARIVYEAGSGNFVEAYVAAWYLSRDQYGYDRVAEMTETTPTEIPEIESTPEPTPTPKPKSEEMSPKELIAELRTAKTIAEPFTVLVHPSHPTGRVNLRWAPCKKAQALTSYNADKELTVIGETRNWYQVQDPQQKYNGFIAKYQVTLSDFGTAE